MDLCCKKKEFHFRCRSFKFKTSISSNDSSVWFLKDIIAPFQTSLRLTNYDFWWDLRSFENHWKTRRSMSRASNEYGTFPFIKKSFKNIKSIFQKINLYESLKFLNLEIAKRWMAFFQAALSNKSQKSCYLSSSCTPVWEWSAHKKVNSKTLLKEPWLVALAR